LSAQGGNESAFNNLHDLWRADIRRMAAVRLGDSDSVDEIVNVVWLAIARGNARSRVRARERLT